MIQAAVQEDSSQVRRYSGMRRGFGLAAGATLAFLLVIAAEMDHPLFLVDDTVAGILGAIVLVIYFVKRKEISVSALKSQSNLFFGLLLVAYVVKLVWIGIEMGDPDAVGDDYSSIVFIIVLIANRFL